MTKVYEIEELRQAGALLVLVLNAEGPMSQQELVAKVIALPEAKELDVSEAAVRTALDGLCENGMLERTEIGVGLTDKSISVLRLVRIRGGEHV